ncbi:N-acetylglucosamine kinase [Chitinophaga sp. XS-30]|uniref:N-acetylglucosamine kinase n=1 Tax=Chitinophaga sp. XS-30 TaxID=2604421 RepID=UPI0011DCB345|nr:N-acetylglucosamine kinase [Chitinophaga sp. XS-30]QEH41574.1 N-acetylglucosamine kinase [Chitinophaga sp. XS-30]
MKLIADGGSTKASWCLICPGKEELYFNTEGYNPYYVDSQYIRQSLHRALPAEVPREAVTEVHFYGAGCEPSTEAVIIAALGALFGSAAVSAGSDLLAAARALLGNEPGFAAILGTGTNTCLYDGAQVTHSIDPLGYMLGDEGSGSYIGKKLLIAYCREYLPLPLRREFLSVYGLTKENIMERVYKGPLANRFCAGFAKFVKLHLDDAFVYQLAKDAFHDFFRSLVCHYPDYASYTLNCTGSVAFHFEDMLKETAACYGMRTGRIIQDPIRGLAHYYRQQDIFAPSSFPSPPRS